jgi:hypothetical protein
VERDLVPSLHDIATVHYTRQMPDPSSGYEEATAG